MDKIIVFLNEFIKQVRSGKPVDRPFIEKVLSEGVPYKDVEQCLTIVYNLLINRSILSQKDWTKSIRHFTSEEKLSLGDEICCELLWLQLKGLLTPTDLDYLVHGWFELTGFEEQDTVDFWQLVKGFKPDLSDFIEIRKAGHKAKFLN